MSEEEKGVKEQETAEPEALEEDTSQAQEQIQESVQPEEGSKEYNFEKLREKSDKATLKADRATLKSEMLEQEIIKLKQAFVGSAAPLQEEADDLSNLAPDDILTVSQSDKRSERIAKKVVQALLEKHEREALPHRAKSRYNDFEEVMTTENIKKLETEEPELAQACSMASNPWESTYKLLKKFILPNLEGKKKAAGTAKLQEGEARPGSVNSVGRKSPLSDANAWSEASRKDLYKEMMDSAR